MCFSQTRQLLETYFKDIEPTYVVYPSSHLLKPINQVITQKEGSYYDVVEAFRFMASGFTNVSTYLIPDNDKVIVLINSNVNESWFYVEPWASNFCIICGSYSTEQKALHYAFSRHNSSSNVIKYEPFNYNAMTIDQYIQYIKQQFGGKIVECATVDRKQKSISNMKKTLAQYFDPFQLDLINLCDYICYDGRVPIYCFLPDNYNPTDLIPLLNAPLLNDCSHYPDADVHVEYYYVEKYSSVVVIAYASHLDCFKDFESHLQTKGEKK